ncbi:hypothetical protein [Dankookia sp. P2]|uniref:hypothetical protein n=1 Tax=Dankookia sp. P2 TaxID=3423955 RepID=UPI003D679EFC
MTTRRALGALLAASLGIPAMAETAWPPRRSLDPDVTFPEAGPRAWGAQMKQVRIGLLGGENESDRLGRFGPYRDLIEATFKVPARLYPASDYAGVIQAFGAKQLRHRQHVPGRLCRRLGGHQRGRRAAADHRGGGRIGQLCRGHAGAGR